jgi:hypothetical protein
MSPATTASAADSNSASGESARASASMCAENRGQLTKSWSRAMKSCAPESEHVAVSLSESRPLSRASRSILSTSRSISFR